MAEKVKWGIIGTGSIAQTFARALAASQTGQPVGIGSRTQASADAFAQQFKVPTAYGSYDALIHDPNVHAVYVSTPHPMHAEWAIRAANAGKHVLCEKPLAVNHADAMAIIQAAKDNRVFLMEAFMYRCHPQTAALVNLLRENAIGQVRAIHASFSFRATYGPTRRHFSHALAGGGILDVGCYTASMARLIAGAASGKDFSDAVEVKGVAHLGETGVDEWAAASAKFPGNIIAELFAGLSLEQEPVVRIFGSEGRITLPNPWVCNREVPDPGRILIQRRGEPAREIEIPTRATTFTLEADVVGAAILSGAMQGSSPAMTWDDTLGNMRLLDQWRESVGLTYEQETPPAYRSLTVAGVPLARRNDAAMKYGHIDGIDMPVSRMVMGCDNQRNFAQAAILWDDFFQAGGNTFDTAWIYGGGLQEKLLGQWMKHRNVRDQLVLICKGAHSPLCTPRDLTRQLFESLERLGTDHADVYLMHRDNLDVPVGEFVEVLNEHQRAGRFKVFGASNWTLPRIDLANEYAQKHNLSPLSVLSNQLSLARMVDAPWQNCLSASDPASRAWLTRTQTPLLAWSSQARGFFRPRTKPEYRDDPELVRCWYSEDNFQRLDRARQLAQQLGVEAIHIALAYVLHQPFPTFCLIGPRLLSELRSSLAALDVKLSEEQVQRLNLEDAKLQKTRDK
jgi:predicted dehydrogenase/aryl-alcohol dehydrogenase-like predicted oxidoreductase